MIHHELQGFGISSWAGLGWAGLGWAGLGWAGLGWVPRLEVWWNFLHQVHSRD